MSSDPISSPRNTHAPIGPQAAEVQLRLRCGRILWASAELAVLLGWNPHEWIGHGVEEFLHPDGLGGVDVRLAQIGPGQRVIWRDRLRSHDGRWHWVQLEVTPYTGTSGDGADAVARLLLMAEGADTLPKELGHRLHFDELTDLLNRREVMRRLDRLQGEERRRSRGAMAVLFCDLDEFKAINDRWGHRCGDEVLREVARRLRRHLRSIDLAARIGGDELLLVLDGVDDLEDALSVAEALRLAVAQPLSLPDGRGFAVPTLSIGVTLARPHELTAELIERADAAMYRAKRNGRNQVAAMPT